MKDKYINLVTAYLKTDEVRKHLSYADLMELGIKFYTQPRPNFLMAKTLLDVAAKGTSEKEIVLPVTEQLVSYIQQKEMTRLHAMKIHHAIVPVINARVEAADLLNDIASTRDLITECEQELKRFRGIITI